MSFLTNNGLLWLILSFALALIILLVIYIIKPNYQQKFVSSTFVWKLSLMYRKKRIPLNRLRSILILICQILILAACAFIIASPAISLLEDIDTTEIVIVMDVSASMRTVDADGVSRIERATEEAYSLGSAVLQDGGIVSLVSCGNGSELLVERAKGSGARHDLEEKLQNIADEGCTYASTDLNGALQLCEDMILGVNPDAEIYVCTDAIYTDSYTSSLDGVNIMYIADESTEWNATILSAYTEKIDGYYALFIEFATYGMNGYENTTLNFEVTIKNPRYQGDKLETTTVGINEYFEFGGEMVCDGEETSTYVFMFDETYDTTYAPIIGAMDNVSVNSDSAYTIYYYEEIEIRLSDDTNDSYDLDNVYYVYGGQPQVISILYTTEDGNANPFLPAVLSTMQTIYADTYDMIISYEYSTSSKITEDKEGYDLYIFEHVYPEALPKDGIVLLFDPAGTPEDAGFDIVKSYVNVETNYECWLYPTEEAAENPLMYHVNAENISLTKASLVDNYQDEYVSLMEFTCSEGAYPALLMKDSGDSKVIVMPFDINYSNISMTAELPLLFNNLFTYFFPATVDGSEFVVGDTIELNSNGMSFEIWETYLGEITETRIFRVQASDDPDEAGYYIVETGEGWEGTLIEMPVSFYALEPGKYLLRTESYFYDPDNTSQQKYTDVMIFVRADLSESDIFSYGTALSSPYRERDVSELYDDLLLWFAVALVALIFIEWILHMLEGI